MVSFAHTPFAHQNQSRIIAVDTAHRRTEKEVQADDEVP